MSMIGVLALLGAAVAVPSPPPVDAAVIDDAGMITVTAARLTDLASAAADCARSQCPTRTDVAVTVSYASALFDAGNYLDAKRLLAAGVDRLRWAVRAEPVAISTLYQAQASLAMHEGDQDTTRAATWASRNALSNDLADAPGARALARLSAEFRLADWQLRTGDRVGAEARYAAIAAQAASGGQQQLADVATLRRAQVLDSLDRRTESRAILETLAARPDAASGDVRRAALASAARMASAVHDTAAADGFIARLAALPRGAEPFLLSEPKLPVPGAPRDNEIDPVGAMDRGARGADMLGLRWVDIGFWIRPDGRVDDVTIMRSSPRPDWARPLLGQVGGRRYAAFAADGADGQGRYRIERYTLTADYDTPVGSLVRRRLKNKRYEMAEMTGATP